MKVCLQIVHDWADIAGSFVNGNSNDDVTGKHVISQIVVEVVGVGPCDGACVEDEFATASASAPRATEVDDVETAIRIVNVVIRIVCFVHIVVGDVFHVTSELRAWNIESVRQQLPVVARFMHFLLNCKNYVKYTLCTRHNLE